MHLFSSVVLLLGALSATATALPKPTVSGAPYCPPRPATQAQKRAILNEFIQKVFVDRNGTRALLDHMAEDYIQHSPMALSGRDNGIAALSFVSPETVNFTVARVGIDGNIGFIYSRMDLVGAERPTAVMDLLRFNGTCIQEHWDVIQEVPANKTNPLPMW